MSWAPDYVTLQELRAFVRIADDLDDVAIGYAITAASRAIDKATGRQFGLVAAPETRYYPPEYDGGRRRWLVQIDDLMTAPTVVSSDSTVTVDYVLRPRNGPVKGRPWTELELGSGAPGPGTEEVAVTARWGWSAVPGTVVEAALLQSNRFLSRRNSPNGVTGSPDAGGELRLLSKVDPDVALMLAAYRRDWWAV